MGKLGSICWVSHWSFILSSERLSLVVKVKISGQALVKSQVIVIEVEGGDFFCSVVNVCCGRGVAV